MEVTAGTDAHLKIHVISALKHLVGGRRREQVVQWMADRKWFMGYGTPPLTEVDWHTADHHALGRDIYALWCQVTRHTPVDGRTNVRYVLDRLARKLGDADAEALAERDGETEHRLQGLLNTYVWRDDYLQCQALNEKDLDYVANTIWKHNVAPNLTDEDSVAIEERRRAKAPVREYEDAELRGLILRWLRDNRRYAYTYGEAVKEYRCDWKQASRILHSLAKRGPEVVLYHEPYLDAKGGRQKKKLFKFCPERREMDADYTRAGKIVSGVLMRFIASHPDKTKRAIRIAMREYFGYIADKVVDDTLAGLIADGSVGYKQGKQGAHLHFIALPLETLS